MMVYLCLAHDSEHINSSLGRLRGQDRREGQEIIFRGRDGLGTRPTGPTHTYYIHSVNKRIYTIERVYVSILLFFKILYFLRSIPNVEYLKLHVNGFIKDHNITICIIVILSSKFWPVF